MTDKSSLVASLHDLGAVQFGEYQLKSGEISPVYLDLRLLVSQPATLRRVAQMMQAYVDRLKFDRLAAIPLGGMPIGVALSLVTDRPMIYPRMDAKGHGTGRLVEGTYQEGEVALLVDDVLSRADSKLEAIGLLEEAGLRVNDLVVVIDRQMGGVKVLEDGGYTVHHLLTLREMLDTLHRLKRISEKQHQDITDWIESRSESQSR